VKYSIDRAVAYLIKHAQLSSQHACAKSVRKALSAGGIDIRDHPVPAKDYGPFLIKAGFRHLNLETEADYKPIKGDIVVLPSYPGGIYGHIAMYVGGAKWVSDYFQDEGMWADRRYKSQGLFDIYRP